MEKYIFIDESGSPQFYAKRRRPLWIEPGFVPIICLGMVITDNRIKLRKKVSAFAEHVLNDPLLNSIYSVRQPEWYLHARSDHSDINLKMAEFLRQIDGFKFNAVIGRKIPEIFINKHNGNATEFYFDLMHKLLELEELSEDCKYHLYLSQRHSNTEQRFVEAFRKTVEAKSREIAGLSFTCSIVRSRDFPELSVTDYLLWALQRYILKGERRYFTALEKHYEKILDVYENEGKGRLYDDLDNFDLSKASVFVVK
jgi:Protein of unknown function (DUF3800)